MSEILYCHCAYSRIIPDGTRREVLSALTASGRSFTAVADLCELAADKDARLAKFANADDAVVIACFPRAVRGLFNAAKTPLKKNARILNMRTQTAAGILLAIGVEKASGPADEGVCEQFASPAKDRWIPWFPVIDADRCINCKRCVGFCLFGVYGQSPDGAAEVQNPANCKTNCPACSRICPTAAIMFPKYPHAPINGDAVTAENIKAQKMQADLDAAIKNDAMELLRSGAASLGQTVPFDELARKLSKSVHGKPQ